MIDKEFLCWFDASALRGKKKKKKNYHNASPGCKEKDVTSSILQTSVPLNASIDDLGKRWIYEVVNVC